MVTRALPLCTTEEETLVAVERVEPLALESGRHGSLLDKESNVCITDPILRRGDGIERGQRMTDRHTPGMAVEDAGVDVERRTDFGLKIGEGGTDAVLRIHGGAVSGRAAAGLPPHARSRSSA